MYFWICWLFIFYRGGLCYSDIEILPVWFITDFTGKYLSNDSRTEIQLERIYECFIPSSYYVEKWTLLELQQMRNLKQMTHSLLQYPSEYHGILKECDLFFSKQINAVEKIFRTKLLHKIYLHKDELKLLKWLQVQKQINTLQTIDEELEDESKDIVNIKNKGHMKQGSGLGRFGKLWNYLKHLFKKLFKERKTNQLL